MLTVVKYIIACSTFILAVILPISICGYVIIFTDGDSLIAMLCIGICLVLGLAIATPSVGFIAYCLWKRKPWQWMVILMISLAIIDFSWMPIGWAVNYHLCAGLRDMNNCVPDETVKHFIQLVIADDYESARALWYGPSKCIYYLDDGTLYDGSTPFEIFCSRYKHIDIDQCKISKAYRGKSGFSGVNIDWEENGEKKHDSFGLKIIDGEWKIERGYHW